MGGYGSTRWSWHTKKHTVEDCRALSIFDFKREGVLEPEVRRLGSWVWRNAHSGKRTASLGYELNTLDDRSYLRVYYTITRWNRDKEEYDYRIPLVTTSCHFGGFRWWFTCALSINGRYCGRRVAKLYLPPGGSFYGCRHCYDLTYRSSQESDKRVSALRKLGPRKLLYILNKSDVDPLLVLKALPSEIWRR